MTRCRQSGVAARRTWVLALVVAVGSFLASPGSVLCVAAGAHSRVEPVLDSCCTSASAGAGVASASSTSNPGRGQLLQGAANHGCAGCIDLVLDSSSLMSRRLLVTPPAMDVAPGSGAGIVAPRRPDRDTRPEWRAPVPPDPGPLRSVTLLI